MPGDGPAYGIFPSGPPAAIDTKAGAAGIRVLVAGGSFELALPCPDCPRLTGLQVQAARPFEHSSTRVTVRLDKPAPAGDALVFLASASPLAATVPASVWVPAGASPAAFDEVLYPAHDGPAAANLTTTCGGAEAQAAVTVLPIA